MIFNFSPRALEAAKREVKWKWRWRSPAKYCRSAMSTWRHCTICCGRARFRRRRSLPRCWLLRRKLSRNLSSENLLPTRSLISSLCVRSGFHSVRVFIWNLCFVLVLSFHWRRFCNCLGVGFIMIWGKWLYISCSSGLGWCWLNNGVINILKLSDSALVHLD